MSTNDPARGSNQVTSPPIQCADCGGPHYLRGDFCTDWGRIEGAPRRLVGIRDSDGRVHHPDDVEFIYEAGA